MTQYEILNKDGFRPTAKTFIMPARPLTLDPARKREVTICNLFANHRLPLRDIATLLDENYEHVVNTLVKHELIFERRQIQRVPVRIERRRSLLEGLE